MSGMDTMLGLVVTSLEVGGWILVANTSCRRLGPDEHRVEVPGRRREYNR